MTQPFEQQLSALGGDVSHYMPDDGSGVYIKSTKIPAGVRLAMHSHTFTHKSVLAAGTVRVHTGRAEGTLHDAPAVLVMPEGVPHEIEAITDAVWLCIHATSEIDADKIDHHLVRGGVL